jgi:hypothetical protein
MSVQPLRCSDTYTATEDECTRHTAVRPEPTLWRIRCPRHSIAVPLCCHFCLYLRMHFLWSGTRTAILPALTTWRTLGEAWRLRNHRLYFCINLSSAIFQSLSSLMHLHLLYLPFCAGNLSCCWHLSIEVIRSRASIYFRPIEWEKTQILLGRVCVIFRVRAKVRLLRFSSQCFSIVVPIGQCLGVAAGIDPRVSGLWYTLEPSYLCNVPSPNLQVLDIVWPFRSRVHMSGSCNKAIWCRHRGGIFKELRRQLIWG